MLNTYKTILLPLTMIYPVRMKNLTVAQQCKNLFVGYLRSYCDRFYHESDPFSQVMRYALLGRAKRVRPLLLMLTGKVLGASIKKTLRPALAIELIHTYSLIHDDLPAMDNDDWRRGRPTVHKKFNEASAVLAGNALLGDALQIIVDNSEVINDEPKIHRRHQPRIIKTLTEIISSNGLVRGQYLDLHDNFTNRTQIADVQRRKTGQLLAACCRIGAIIAYKNQSVIEQFTALGNKIGQLFQIIDDLDDAETINDGASYLTIMSIDETQQLASEIATAIQLNFEQLAIANSPLATYVSTLSTQPYLQKQNMWLSE